MGMLSSAEGINIVVPAYFVCAGILIFAAVTAAVVGIYRRRVPLYYVFALACLFAAGVAVSTGSYYVADSVAGAVAAQRWLATSTLLLVGSIVVFIGMYTGARALGPWMIAIEVVLAGLIAANHVLPFGIRYESVSSFGFLHLPWGESLFRIDGVTGPGNLAYRALMAVVAAWALWRLNLQYRHGERREAQYLALCLLVLFVASMQGALIDHGILRTFHWSAFALVGMAMLVGGSLVMRLREQNLEFEAATRALQLENGRRQEAEAQLRERAYRDSLTGLPNRIHAHDHLCGLIERGRPGAFGAVLILDLDHFKFINDALSHAVGDDLLREVVARLLGRAANRAVVARVDGNAFMAILEGFCEVEDAARARIDALALDFAQEMTRPINLGERTLIVFASMGVATFSLPGTSAAEIFGRAEMALQRAKKRGRNNIQVFLPALRHEAAERYQVVEGLRHAIETDELALHFQPQIDRDGRIVGAEALMRWRSGTLGQVSPATFIPIAEESGLIHSLGEWSLRRGCERLAAWAREGSAFEAHLSVNVSPWQLSRPDFSERLIAIVEDSGVDPERLMLEITESAVLFDVQDTVAKLREIRPFGVRLALDDFGTGYSSLALIKDLPLDAIKIDQTFVRHLDEGANKHLVRMIVAIGEELGMDVIAEGVETQADRDALVALGCPQLQGYFCGRPMPEAQFLEWVSARSAGAPMARSLSI